MLSDAVKETIQQTYRRWLESKGVKARYGQRLMIAEVARAFANAASSLQDVLGDLNDSVVAARWLDGWAARADDAEAARGATSLAALERSAALEQRGHWRAALHELSEPELRAWM